MKKKNIAIIFSVAILIICSYLLTACDFSSWFRRTLETPTLNINNIEKTISWQEVAGASTYDVYLNDEIVATVNNQATNTYNFSENISEELEICVFYVVAKAEGYNNSAKSNTATFVNINSNTAEVTGIVANNQEHPISNLTISNNLLYWDKVENVSEYYVMLFDNVGGYKVISTDARVFDFTEYVVFGQILALRVGIKNAANEVCFSETVYYNDALNVAEYSKDAINFKDEMNNIFIFKGKVYDHYITDQEEMNIGVYHAFVNKIKTSEFTISTKYYNLLCNLYTDQYYLTGNGANIPGAVGLAANSYNESCDYSLSLSTIFGSPAPKRNFKLLFTFNGLGTEPTLSMNKTKTQNALEKGYYEKVNYEKRNANYNNFASDKKLLTEYVTTSEQLYFAVENGVTPLFKSTTSSAYKIYNKAKDVLKEIICDEMTDYEKALSIFDWICLNSVYDSIILNYVKPNSSESFTDYTSFSLEGVLNDGLAVCDGFSKTFSLLCNMEGISAIRLSGGIDENNNNKIDSYEELHAWNKVLINGSWYVVDITWSVFTSEDNDFSTTASEFNNAEFLNHTYFLVADADIPHHIPTDSVVNNTHAAPNRYYYYYNQKYDGQNNLIITKNEDLVNLVAFMLENEIYAIDVVFDYNAYGSYTALFDYPIIDAAIKEAKRENGIPTANIVCVGSELIFATSANRGLIFSLTLVNLPLAEPTAA